MPIRDPKAWPEPDHCEYSYKGHTIVATKRASEKIWIAFDLGNASLEVSRTARAAAVRDVMDMIDEKLADERLESATGLLATA